MSDDVPVRGSGVTSRRDQAPNRNPYDTVRRRRRAQWLGILALPILVLTLLAAKLLSVPIASYIFNEAFDSQDVATMHRAAGVLKFLNFTEPYKAFFDDGDAYVVEKNYDAARKEFEQALTLAPPEAQCTVRVNLVLTIEQQAGAAQSSGSNDSAQALARHGVQLVNEAPKGCFEPNNPANAIGQGQQLEEAKKRLEPQESQQQQNQQNQQNQDQNQSGTSKDQQLRQQQKQAQEERRQDNGGVTGGDGNQPGNSGSNNPGVDKPW